MTLRYINFPDAWRTRLLLLQVTDAGGREIVRYDAQHRVLTKLRQEERTGLFNGPALTFVWGAYWIWLCGEVLRLKSRLLERRERERLEEERLKAAAKATPGAAPARWLAGADGAQAGPMA